MTRKRLDQSYRLKGRLRYGSRRGSEMIEFTMALLPLLALTLVLMDSAWAIFVKSTLQRAVRVGVRYGVTLTATDVPNGSCLTDVVKTKVQQNALGTLNGASGLAKIKVNYYQPPAPNSSGAATDVSGQASGNTSGNIMQVSVQNYSLVPLVPRLQWTSSGTRVDNNPLVFNVYSADLIEPSRNPPCIGTAP